MRGVDRFGNRWQQNGPQTFLATFTGNNQGNPQNNNRMDGYPYDAAGNLRNDGTHNYFYDAENRLIQVDGTLGTCTSPTTACYAYDADGNRVQKISTTGSGGEFAGTWQFLYDQSGRMIQRFDGTFWQGNIYVGGRHLVEDGAVTNFSHADWLGTERMRSTNTGAVCESIASLPFGDGQTTTGACYHSSPLHFTGKERDSESGLDYFGARFDASSFGRFMSPDPLYVELHRLIDPQQLNLYSYVRNNPLSLTDPTGLDITCTGDRCKDYLAALQKDVSFKVKYDDNGKVVADVDKDQKLSKSDKAFLKAIDDTKNHVTINAVGGEKDSSVFFGASHGSTHTINFDQAALLDSAKNAGGMTSAQLVGHETLEGYDESKGYTMDEGHNWAASLGFPGFDKATASSALLQNGMVIGLKGTFHVQGTSINEQIQTRYVTPIPQADFLQGKGLPAAGYPVGVEKKQ